MSGFIASREQTYKSTLGTCRSDSLMVHHCSRRNWQVRARIPITRRPDRGWTAIGTDFRILGSLCSSAVVETEVSWDGLLGTRDELGVVDAAIVENDERDDLKVRKVKTHVDVVESDDEVYQRILVHS